VPAVARVIAVTGRAPAVVVANRGLGTAANDQAMEALDVKRIGLQRNGTPARARLALERTRRCLTWVGLGIVADNLQRLTMISR
jgi:IS5 family transposase